MVMFSQSVSSCVILCLQQIFHLVKLCPACSPQAGAGSVRAGTPQCSRAVINIINYTWAVPA